MFGPTDAKYLFIALIALVYSVVAPLVLPFCFLYFMITGFTTKYCLYYINITKIETGGSFWKVRQTMRCLAILMLTDGV